MTAAERFWSKVHPANDLGCTEWAAHRSPQGYGRLAVDGAQLRAHRFAWELMRGPIPDGLQVLHRCDNRACVNVEHLFLGTQKDNIVDMIAKGRDARGDKNGARSRPERLPRGEAHGRAKLSAEDVMEIRSRCAGGESHSALAMRFGVGRATIGLIHRRQRWTHLLEDGSDVREVAALRNGGAR
jgi:hypothetical protein